MTSENWEYVRAKVLNSEILRQVLEKSELYEVEAKGSSYTLKVNDRTGRRKGEAKSRYRIAEELGKKYPSVIRALGILKDYGLTLPKKRGKSVAYVWTLQAVLLFPEMATVDGLTGLLEGIFGKWEKFGNWLSSSVGLSDKEAESLMYFICWNCVDFISWIRDDIFIRREREDEDLPHPDDNRYWWKAALVYMLKEYFLNISENPKTYFDNLKKNLAKYAHKEIPNCILAFDKLRAFGSRWLLENQHAFNQNPRQGTEI